MQLLLGTAFKEQKLMFSGEVAWAEGGCKGTGRYMGSECMTSDPQRINKQNNFKIFSIKEK